MGCDTNSRSTSDCIGGWVSGGAGNSAVSTSGPGRKFVATSEGGGDGVGGTFDEGDGNGIGAIVIVIVIDSLFSAIGGTVEANATSVRI